MRKSWWKLSTDLAMLGVESQMVIGQRIAMIAVGGPKARSEARRMINEKVLAAGDAAVTLTMGGSLHNVARGYRKKVRANARRLGKR